MLVPAGHLGNFAPGAVLDFKVHTRRDDTFLPASLAGTPAAVLYKANSTGETLAAPAGLVLTPDFDGKTGCHHVRLDTAADVALYTAAHYQVVLAQGTVNGVDHAGAVLATFGLDGQLELLNAIAGALVAIKGITDRVRFEGPAETERLAAVLAAADHAAIATALLTLPNGVEAGLTVRESQQALFATMAALVSGFALPVPPGPVRFRNKANSKDRVVVTLDGSGNRLTITYNFDP